MSGGICRQFVRIVHTPNQSCLVHARDADQRRIMPAIALRGLFAGAGSAMMSSSLVVDAVLELTKKPDPRDVRLLYLGKLGTNVA